MNKTFLIKIITYISSYVIFLLLLILLDLILTSDKHIYKNVFSNTNVNLVYSNEENITGSDCIKSYDMIEEFVFFDLKDGNLEDFAKKIVIVDKIFINGNWVWLKKNQVYISDYIYDKGLDECLDGEYPKRHEYKSIFLSEFNNVFMNVEIIPFLTNYTSYIPNENSDDYVNETKKFSQMCEDYYEIIYMTNEFYCELQTKSNGFSLNDNFIEIYSDQSIIMNEKLENKNEFFISVGDFLKYFGYSDEEFLANSEELIRTHIGEKITINFTGAKKSISKELIFNGVSTRGGGYYDWSIIITPELYSDIYAELQLDKHESWNEFKTVYYVDINEKDFYDFVSNESYSVEKIAEMERMIINKKRINPILYTMFGMSLLIYVLIFSIQLKFYAGNQYKLIRRNSNRNLYLMLVINVLFTILCIILFISFRISIKRLINIFM